LPRVIGRQNRRTLRWILIGAGAARLVGDSSSLASLRLVSSQDLRQLDLSGYKLTFDDEFNTLSAGTPGTSKVRWETTPSYGDRSTNGQGFIVDDAVGGSPYAVDHGVLTMRLRPTTKLQAARGIDQPYTVGYLDTQQSFTQTYGYFEMRAQLPGVQGASSAFWLLPASLAWPPEIDVLEVSGENASRLSMTNHTGPTHTDTRDENGPDLSVGMHVYGLKWTPTTLTWYLDGEEQFSAPTGGDEHVPMYMIISAYVHAHLDWLKPPANPRTFSADYRIDWVHAYSNQPGVGAIPGQPGYQDHDGSLSAPGRDSAGDVLAPMTRQK
jgi:serralysin